MHWQTRVHCCGGPRGSRWWPSLRGPPWATHPAAGFATPRTSMASRMRPAARSGRACFQGHPHTPAAQVPIPPHPLRTHVSPPCSHPRDACGTAGTSAATRAGRPAPDMRLRASRIAPNSRSLPVPRPPPPHPETASSTQTPPITASRSRTLGCKYLRCGSELAEDASMEERMICESPASSRRPLAALWLPCHALRAHTQERMERSCENLM